MIKYQSNETLFRATASWVKILGGGMLLFWQTAAIFYRSAKSAKNFYFVFISAKMGIFGPELCILDENFLTKIKFFFYAIKVLLVTWSLLL